MSISVEGINKVVKRLEKTASPEKVRASLGKACALVERAAKENAPKGTGELRRSITSTIEGSGTNLSGIVFTPLEYAPYVEYGTGLFAEEGGRQNVPWNYKDDEGNWHSTSGMPPRPFMRPAIENNRLQIMRILKEGMKDD